MIHFLSDSISIWHQVGEKDLMRRIAEYANAMEKVERWTLDRERRVMIYAAC